MIALPRTAAGLVAAWQQLLDHGIALLKGGELLDAGWLERADLLDAAMRRLQDTAPGALFQIPGAPDVMARLEAKRRELDELARARQDSIRGEMLRLQRGKTALAGYREAQERGGVKSYYLTRKT